MARNNNIDNTYISYNKAEGGLEIHIARGYSLDGSEKEWLKARHFNWHRGQYKYYTLFSEELLEEIKQNPPKFLQGVTVKAPTESCLKEMKAVAEKKMEQRKVKAANAAANRKNTNAELMEAIRLLTAEVAALKAGK